MTPSPRCLAVLCALALACAPVAADVIPVQTDSSREHANRAVVGKRLSNLGLDREAADHMTPSETAHFAAHPEALQVVAGLHAEEALLGTLVLITIGAIAASILQNTN